MPVQCNPFDVCSADAFVWLAKLDGGWPEPEYPLQASVSCSGDGSGIGGFLLAPLSALESFLKSKLKTFVEAFGPWLGVVDEELDVLLASDLMQGGVEKIMCVFFVGVRCTKQIWRVAGRRVDARAFGCSRLRS